MGANLVERVTSPERMIFVYRSEVDSKRPMRISKLANLLAEKTKTEGIKPVVRTVGGGTLFDFHREYFIAYGVSANDVRKAYRKQGA